MRQIDVTSLEFKRYLWNAYFRGAPKSEDDLEIAVRVTKLLKGVSVAVAISDAEEDAGVLPGRTLIDDKASVIFEEDEYKMVRDRIKEFIPNISNALADEFSEFWERFKGSEKITPQVVEEEDG